jgi:DnaJ-class molecular chaperone
MPAESAKKYFRMVALQLHPDKNCHPLSKSAFQKVQQAMDQS